MKIVAVKLLCLLSLCIIFSLHTNAQTIGISGSINTKSIKRGTVGKGSVTLSIPKELHINSNKPTSEFMIPTVLKLSSNQVKITQIIYPKGKNKKFDFSEEAINVYEGKVLIRFAFSVPKTLKSDTVKISAIVSYQACTNEVCYPPTKKEIFLAAKVR